MGQSTNGMLVYGYNLSNGDEEWAIQEAGEDGEWEPDWMGDEDVVTAAEEKLMVAAGFTETDYKADGYFDRKKAAEGRVGVEFESYCSGDYPMWVLAAHVTTVYRGDAKEIDFAALEQQRTVDDWDGKLAAAVEVLGITPTQGQPKWLLVSYWG